VDPHGGRNGGIGPIFHEIESDQDLGNVINPRNSASVDNVKLVSRDHRIVIALHSPNGVAETGLL
jgi:hypothetical protein